MFVTSFVPPGSTIFFDIISKRCGFRKKVTEHKMRVFIFSTTFVRNISHSKKNVARYCHKCENVYMYSICYLRRILMKLKFCRQIFEKKKKLKCQVSWKSVKWKPSCSNRTLRRTDMTKLIMVAFRNFAKARNKTPVPTHTHTHTQRNPSPTPERSGVGIPANPSGCAV